MKEWEARFAAFLERRNGERDPSHDLAHAARVVATAKRLAAAERARLDIVVPAAWLHDCVKGPPGAECGEPSSVLAAREAARFLRAAGYPEDAIPGIEHAIEAHSFSAAIEARTLEARIVRDADRLDAIGAIGISRCLLRSGGSGRSLYSPDEPFPRTRVPDDRAFAVDHFFTKLLLLEATMETTAARREARDRSAFLREFLDRLAAEIGEPPPFDRLDGSDSFLLGGLREFRGAR